MFRPGTNLISNIRRKHLNFLWLPPQYPRKHRPSIPRNILHILGPPLPDLFIPRPFRPSTYRPVLPFDVDIGEACIVQPATELLWSSQIETDFGACFE